MNPEWGTCAWGTGHPVGILSRRSVIIGGGNRALRRAGRHGEINFFNVMLPVHSLMTEIYTWGEEHRNFPERHKGKSQPSGCFASGRVHRAPN